MDTLWIPFKYVLVHWLVVEPHLKKYESRNGFIFPKINQYWKAPLPRVNPAPLSTWPR